MTSKNVNICLSGGGFRAAFFHLGALYALAQSNKLAESSLLVTVSGGSIAAAFLMAELAKSSIRNDLTKTCDFEKAVINAYINLWKFSRDNPRARSVGSVRALSSILVQGEFGFGKAMARQYSGALSKGFDLANFPMGWINSPEWRIATSDYLTGRRTLVVANQHLSHRSKNANYLTVRGNDIYRALAASSAVPGVFEPIQIGGHYLGDGGILDNQGIREIQSLTGENICIDASAPLFDKKKQNSWGTILRAMDMLMEQSRDDGIRSVSATIISLRADKNEISEAGLFGHLLPMMRTDLDYFSSIEAAILFLSGFKKAGGEEILDSYFNDNLEACLWSLLNSTSLTVSQQEIVKEINAHLDRGRYRMFSWLRKFSWLSVIAGLNNFFSSAGVVYMVFGYLVLALYLLLMAVPADLSISTFVAVVWLFLSLILYFTGGGLTLENRERRVLGFFRALCFAPVIIPFSLLAVGFKAAWLSPTRDYGLSRKVMSKLGIEDIG